MRKTTQKEDKRQGIDKNENRDMIEAVAALAKEKNISKELLFSAIEEALKSAYKNNFSKEYGMPPSNANVRVELNRETGAVRLYARKTVERWPTDEATEISIEEAQAIQPSYQQDDIVEVEVTPDNFRRVAAQTAKQVIVQQHPRGRARQDLRRVHREGKRDPHRHRASAIRRRKDVYVELGTHRGRAGAEPADARRGCCTSATASRSTCWKSSRPPSGASGREARPAGQRVSRIHPGLVKRLFELEVPEIAERHRADQVHRPRGGQPHQDGRAFHRSDDRPGGRLRRPARQPRGSRGGGAAAARRSTSSSGRADPAEFVANALNPAHVVSVFVTEQEKACRVVVPDNQLSLAIGKEGQNARLAAKLTGWKIDIKSQSQIDEQVEAEAAEAPSAEGDAE